MRSYHGNIKANFVILHLNKPSGFPLINVKIIRHLSQTLFAKAMKYLSKKKEIYSNIKPIFLQHTMAVNVDYVSYVNFTTKPANSP